MNTQSNRTNEQRAAEVTADIEILRHTLGIGTHIKLKDWGYRNYFNAEDGHSDMPSLLRLEAMGLIRRSGPGYWHATEAGCKVAGLDEKQTKRALND